MGIVKVMRGTGITKRDFYSVCLYKGNRRENARYVSELFRSKGETVEDELAEYAAARSVPGTALVPTDTAGLLACVRVAFARQKSCEIKPTYTIGATPVFVVLNL
jgi:hypothetical protein